MIKQETAFNFSIPLSATKIFLHARLKILTGSLLIFSLVLSAASSRFWEKVDPAIWTPDQVTQFTTMSPWAKQVTAELVSNTSNMATSVEPRGDGHRRSIDSDSNSRLPSPSALPKLPAVVRWVSAKPMLQVLRVKLPKDFDAHYVLSVSGLPLSGDTTRVSEDTTLVAKRGLTVHPDVVYQDPDDSSTIYFGFLESVVDVSEAKSVLFTMIATPYAVKVKFNVGEMRYQGAASL